MDEQFDAALEAARVLLLRAAVGGDVPAPGAMPNGNVNVTLSGHANPGHKPRQGWANDMVHMTVTSAAVA